MDINILMYHTALYRQQNLVFFEVGAGLEVDKKRKGPNGEPVYKVDENGKPKPDKSPRYGTWESLSTGRYNPDLNLAIRTGEVKNSNGEVVVYLFGVDVDIKTEQGLENFKRDLHNWTGKTFEEWCETTWIVKTTRGGFHLYLKGNDFSYGFKNRTKIKFDGYDIDIRNHNGYLVAPPSTYQSVGFGDYKFITDIGNTDIAECTKEITDWINSGSRLAIKPRASPPSSTSHSTVDKPDIPFIIPEEDKNKNIYRLSEALDPSFYEDYDKWVLLMFWCRSIGAYYFAHWLSHKADNYDPEEVDDKYYNQYKQNEHYDELYFYRCLLKSFNDNYKEYCEFLNKNTEKTWLSHDFMGLLLPRKIKEEEEPFYKRHITIQLNQWFYDVYESTDCDHFYETMVDKEEDTQFRMLYSKKGRAKQLRKFATHEFEYIDSKKEPKPFNFITDVWDTDRFHKYTPIRYVFLPYQQAPPDAVNLWCRYAGKDLGKENFIYAKKIAQPYLDHLKMVNCNGEDKCFNNFMDWMYHVIFAPTNTRASTLVLRSDMGAGKSVQYPVFCNFMGQKYCDAKADVQELLHPKYNEKYDIYKRININDEAASKNAEKDKEFICQMKFDTKSKDRTVRQIYGPPIVIPNIICMIVFTNEFNSVWTSGGQERRFQFMKTAEGYNLENHPDQDYRRQIEAFADNRVRNQHLYDCLITVFRHYNPDAANTRPDVIHKYPWQVDEEDKIKPKWVEYVLEYCRNKKIKWDEPMALMDLEDFLENWLLQNAHKDYFASKENNKKPLFANLLYGIKRQGPDAKKRFFKEDKNTGKRRHYLRLKEYFDEYFARKITNNLPKWWEADDDEE